MKCAMEEEKQSSKQKEQENESVEEEFATVEEAARWLQVHTGSLRSWIDEGEIPAIQPSGPHGKIRVRWQSVREFIAKHTVNKGKLPWQKKQEDEHDE